MKRGVHLFSRLGELQRPAPSAPKHALCSNNSSRATCAAGGSSAEETEKEYMLRTISELRCKMSDVKHPRVSPAFVILVLFDRRFRSPTFRDGVASVAVDQVVDSGSLYFKSAGNSGTGYRFMSVRFVIRVDRKFGL